MGGSAMGLLACRSASNSSHRRLRRLRAGFLLEAQKTPKTFSPPSPPGRALGIAVVDGIARSPSDTIELAARPDHRAATRVIIEGHMDTP
jgi:hypothetical protein